MKINEMKPFHHTDSRDILEGYCNFFAYSLAIGDRGDYYWIGSDQSADFYSVCINIADWAVGNGGLFDCDETCFLEHYFQFPLFPTKEEKALFLIEFGVEYPLKTLAERLQEIACE